MRLRDGIAAMHGGSPGARSLWRFFPWAVMGAMSVVVAVNTGMVYFALHTFPGQVGSDGFDLSNHYDQVLESAQRQAALGWDLRTAPVEAGRAVLTLTDRSGEPLRGAHIEAVAERPLGAAETTHLAFHDAGAGRYVADAALTIPGQWELQVSASAQGHAIATTRRIVVPSQSLPPLRESSADSAG